MKNQNFLLKHKFALLCFAALSLFRTECAHSYYSTIDTGELLPKGRYRSSIETNVVTNDMNGLNLVGRVDMGFNESSNFRALIGAGAVGFQTGLLYKWIPIPDYENQPAIGLLGGFVFARDEGNNFLSLRVHPLISKKLKSEAGLFTPFAALPFGITTTKAKNTFPMQFTAGSEWKPNDWKYVSFMAEVGVNLHESFGYVSAAVLVLFDEEGNLKLE